MGPADFVLLVLTAAIWAGAFVGIKIAVPTLGPVGVAAARAAIGFAVLLPFALAQGLPRPQRPGDWGLLLLMGSLNISLPFFLISWAEQTVSAGVASLFMGVGPFFAIVGAHYFNEGDQLTPRRWLGVIIGFSGLLLLLGFDTLRDAASGVLPAQLALLGACLCYVTSGLLVRRIALPPLALATYALAIATVTLVPIQMLTQPPMGTLTRDVALAVAYLGLIPTGLAYLLRFHLIRTVGYATFALSINLIPVFGVLLGALILRERPEPTTLLALALVLTGLSVARTAPPRERARA